MKNENKQQSKPEIDCLSGADPLLPETAWRLTTRHGTCLSFEELCDANYFESQTAVVTAVAVAVPQQTFVIIAPTIMEKEQEYRVVGFIGTAAVPLTTEFGEVK
ncbi:unnamed protein product [Enterobius vermicularis]|uniref:Uncharacterized protein n=1 Tax=Enterobius vermicularis TaxID=51028 RepID=A0A0N4VJA0_ENTVE|nr:unnamed protein product [Enterobius vermicularis]